MAHVLRGSQIYLHTPLRSSASGMNHTNEMMLISAFAFPAEAAILIYRPRRDGRMSWPWCPRSSIFYLLLKFLASNCRPIPTLEGTSTSPSLSLSSRISVHIPTVSSLRPASQITLSVSAGPRGLRFWDSVPAESSQSGYLYVTHSPIDTSWDSY